MLFKVFFLINSIFSDMLKRVLMKCLLLDLNAKVMQSYPYILFRRIAVKTEHEIIEEFSG